MAKSVQIPICLWSGPRNVSTALMYSFAERDDIRIVDEPLYAHYLRVSGAIHPGRDDVLASMSSDGDSVMKALLAAQGEDNTKRYFLKHMAHQLVELDLTFLQQTCNIFLIRDPRDMLPSLTIQLPQATLSDTGLQRQWELYTDLVAAGQQPAVLDSRDLLLNPRRVLAKLCDHIDLVYGDNMLHWRAGARSEDGVWAPHWYEAVHQSTGFAAYTAKTNFPQQLDSLLVQCRPWYEKLYAHAIRAETNGE